MTSILIVDDHRVVRVGLTALIDETDDLTVVGTADDGNEACRLADELRPDVVLMDLSMPVMDGVEATKRILQQNPSIRIVVLTSFSDRERVLAAIDAGAIGYQLKDAASETLLESVRSAAQGQAPLDPRAATAVLDSRVKPRMEAPQLTDREVEVLRLVGGGMLNKQIARKLGIAESTVKTHLANIFQRIGVSDRTQAALWAQDQGLLADG